MGKSRLFGATESEITTRGEFTCPVEQKKAIYEARRSQRRFSVLGVGLPTGSGETIRCTSCGEFVDPGSLVGRLGGSEQPLQSDQPIPAGWPSPSSGAPLPAPGMAPPPPRSAGSLPGMPPPPPSPMSAPPHAATPAPPAVPSPSPPPAIAAPPPGMAPRVLTPDALATGLRRVGPPPSAASPAIPPSTPVLAPAAPPTTQPPTTQPPTTPRTPASDPPRHVAPPPWAAQRDAPAAQPAAAAQINDKTRITTRSRREIRWRIVSDDGAVIEIDGTIVVGRDPSSELVAGSTAVPIADEGRSMSKSHAALTATDDGLFVEDLHSTNGVRIVRGEKETEIAPGTRERLLDGETLLLGDCAFGVNTRSTQ